MHRPTRARTHLVAGLVSAALALAACSDGGEDDGGTPAGDAGGDARTGQTTTTEARPPLDPTDPCALVTGPEIAQAFQMGLADGVPEDTFGLAAASPPGVDTKVCSWETRNGGPLRGVALVVQTGPEMADTFESQKATFSTAGAGSEPQDVDALGDAAYTAGDLLVVLDGDVVFGVSTVADGADAAAEARHAAGRTALARAILDR